MLQPAVHVNFYQLTSRSHGLSFRSSKISNPSTSKHTLSLPEGAPGRHMRYEWRMWGWATINVFTRTSWTKKVRQREFRHFFPLNLRLNSPSVCFCRVNNQGRGLKVDQGFNLSCIKVFFLFANVLWSLRLVDVKVEGQKKWTKKLKSWNPELLYHAFGTTGSMMVN